MKLVVGVAALAITFTTSASVAVAQVPAPLPNFVEGECPFTVPQGYVIRCGSLTVPEDRTPNSNGHTLDLAVAIIKSPSVSPRPDPLVYLNGGPGGSALASITNGLNPWFEAVLADRDLIFLDQRGTGYSTPSLNCLEVETVSPGMGVETFSRALIECRDRLIAEGINLAAYTSAASATDLNDLRLALGYTEWNLYGVSYGTRLALTTAHDEPRGIRSLILNSTLPPSASLYMEGAGNFQRALDVLFNHCRTDLVCNLLYPNLETRLYSLLNSLDQQPLTLQLNSRTLTVDRYALTDLVFNGLYSEATIPYIPATIYDLTEGNLEVLGQEDGSSEREKQVVDRSFSEGMFFSVQCNEAAAFYTYAEVIVAGAAYPNAVRQYWAENPLFGAAAIRLCQEWLPGEPNPIEAQPVRSEIPTLILAGEYDPITPPRWGQQAARTLPHSFFFEIPGLGHNVVGGQRCPVDLMLAFLADPQRAPDGTCLAAMRHPAFVIRSVVSVPFVQGALVVLIVLIGLEISQVWRHRQPWPLAWRVGKIFAGGWYRVMGLIGLLALVYVFTLVIWNATGNPLHRRAVEIIFPLLFGVQAAFIFPPEDEQALEVQLACPRPVVYILLERLMVLAAFQGGLALCATLIGLTLPEAESPVQALVRWLAPTLCIGSVTLYISVVARRATFGILCAVILCLVSIIGGDFLVSNWPFLWFAHLFLQPEHIALPLYILNRSLLITVAVALFFRITRLVADEERILNIR